MFKFKTLHCNNCGSVMLNLPENEVKKLEGLSFLCEECGYHNRLSDFEFVKNPEKCPYTSTISIFKLIPIPNNN